MAQKLQLKSPGTGTTYPFGSMSMANRVYAPRRPAAQNPRRSLLGNAKMQDEPTLARHRPISDGLANPPATRGHTRPRHDRTPADQAMPLALSTYLTQTTPCAFAYPLTPRKGGDACVNWKNAKLLTNRFEQSSATEAAGGSPHFPRINDWPETY